MPKGSNQKYKLTYLMKIMLEKTDDEHGITMSQIIEELEKYGVSSERKSIYTDFQDMTELFGVEIIKEKLGKDTFYHVGSREFELVEVKLLIDAIQASKFITLSKSKELIAKIKGLVSEHQAKQLQRQLFIDDRVKTMNESVYYNVDDIHAAINQNQKICFKYYTWNIEKKQVLRHNGADYVISPWALLWYDDNYYLVGYDAQAQMIKHYRVDKMKNISVVDEPREGKEEFKNFDMARYSKATFGMFHGEKTRVKLNIKNEQCGIFIDRFGKDISFVPVDEQHCEFSVDVNISQQFFGWIFGLGKDVKIVGPANVVTQMRAVSEEILANYK